MNTATINSPMSEFVAGTYPLSRERSVDDYMAEARHARSLALGDFLVKAVNGVGNTVAMVGSAIFAQIYRLVRVLLARIARLLNVHLDMPQEVPQSQAAIDAAAASFTGEQGAVESAVAEAEAMLSQKVTQLIAERVNATTLVDAHGDKYLAFKLQDVGETVARLESVLAEKNGELAASLAEFARKYDMPVDAAIHLLKSENVPRAEKEQNFPPSAVALCDEIEGLAGSLASVQMRFCTYAALGLRLGAQEDSGELRAVSESFISRFANDSMKKSIEELALEDNSPHNSEISIKLGSSDVNSSKYDNNNVLSLVPRSSPTVAEAPVSPPSAPLSRSQRFGAVGEVGSEVASSAFDAEDFDEEGAATALRPRGG